MATTADGKTPEEPRYIEFPHLEHGTTIDGKLALNRWSHLLTKGRLSFMAVRISFC
jgi:dihydroxy-acid dehydratase